MSRPLWCECTYFIHAGRVQSVALRLISERQLEIEAFDPQEYWTVAVSLQPKNLSAIPGQLVEVLLNHRHSQIDKSHILPFCILLVSTSTGVLYSALPDLTMILSIVNLLTSFYNIWCARTIIWTVQRSLTRDNELDSAGHPKQNRRRTEGWVMSLSSVLQAKERRDMRHWHTGTKWGMLVCQLLLQSFVLFVNLMCNAY